MAGKRRPVVADNPRSKNIGIGKYVGIGKKGKPPGLTKVINGKLSPKIFFPVIAREYEL